MDPDQISSRDRLGLRFEFPDGELDRHLVLGDVTDRSVRAWIRAPDGPLTASLRVNGEPVASTIIEPSAAHDHVGAAVIDAGRSRPGARCDVEVDGQVRSARFAPARGAAARFSFAFGSCHQPYRDGPPGQPLQRHPGAGIYPRLQELLEERGAAFAMLLGDQVYSDAVSRISVREALAADETLTDDDLVETYRHLYRGFFNERGFRELAASLPTYLVWDDHDIFDGWGSLLRTTDFDRRLYRAAETAYREYQHLRSPGGSLDDRAPYAYAMWYGDVGFFVLDLRGDRDYEAGRILSAEQWQRLDAFLEDATAQDVSTVFIAASVPVVHASPAMMAALERLPNGTGRDIRDRWDVPTFAAERTALLDRLFAWQVACPRRQIVILSGDVHVAAAFSARQRDRDGHFRQWTSSALSTPSGLQHVLANNLVTAFVRLGERELRVWRRGLATGNNAGVVDVVPADGGGHQLTFTVYQYDPRRDRLRPAFVDRADPRAPSTRIDSDEAP